jgi:hypothetical protein
MLLYPTLRGAELVGTDLVQAVPLVASAALAHIIVGDFELALTVSIVIGAVPAVWAGARLSTRAPDGVIRPALVFVLTASALKLLELSTPLLGLALLIFAVVSLPVWGAFDAASHPQAHWEAAGLDRSKWIRIQALLAPVGVGFAYAIAYFARIRPRVVSSGERALAGEPVPV